MKFGSKFEIKLYLKLKNEYNCEILRKGCPDFLIFSPNRKLFFVEIKKGNCQLKEHQKRFKELLEKMGIKVFISQDGKITDEILQELK